MVKIAITYEGNLHTVATHLPSGKQLCTDAPLDHEGKGETFSPTDLVAAALGTCIVTVIGIYAKNRNLDIKSLRVDVEKKMTDQFPRRIQQLIVNLWLPKELPEHEREKMEKIALSCPVHHSLHPDIKILIHTQVT